MKITDIRMSLRNEERLKAYVVITFDEVFVVRHLRVVKTDNGLLVSMPSRKVPDDSVPFGFTHKDIAHPITSEFRKYIEREVLEHFQKLSNEVGDSGGANGIGYQF